MVDKVDCVFCKIIEGKIPSEKVYESSDFIVINDIKPISLGHCLIIPKQHCSTILDMPDKLGKELISIAKIQGERLIAEGKAEGFNLTQSNFKAANQEVGHVHFHVIPRKKNDGIKPFSKTNGSEEN